MTVVQDIVTFWRVMRFTEDKPRFVYTERARTIGLHHEKAGFINSQQEQIF